MLAIAYNNKNKYSETFIASQVNGLNQPIICLSNGYLPSEFSEDKGKSFRPIKSLKNPKKSLESLLLKKGVTKLLVNYGPSAVKLLPFAKKLGIKLFPFFHGYDTYRSDILSEYGEQYIKIFEYSTQVIVSSEAMKLQLIKLKCNPERITIIPYGINTDFFSPAKKINSVLQLTFCGRLVSKKNPLKVLKCFANFLSHHNGYLNLIGDGYLEKECKQFIYDKSLNSRVKLHGAIGSDIVNTILSKTDVFLNFSSNDFQNDSEGSPVSLMEAMSCGLAVIATRHGGIPNMITDEEDGLLVMENNEKELLKKLILLSESESLRKKLGRNARKRAVADFSVEQYLSKLTNVLSMR